MIKNLYCCCNIHPTRCPVHSYRKNTESMIVVLNWKVETKVKNYGGSYSGLNTGTINFVSHLKYKEGDILSVNDGNYVIEEIIEERLPKGNIWDLKDTFYKVRVTRK